MAHGRSKTASNLTTEDVESLPLDDLLRVVLKASSDRAGIPDTTHEALTVRLSRARLSGRLKQVVASSVLSAACSPSALDFARASVGSWLPSGALVLEIITHAKASPGCLDSLPAADVINAACLGFYRMNGSGMLSSDVGEFFDDISLAYGHPWLQILAAPSHCRMWWTQETTPGSLREVCSSLGSSSTRCSGDCRVAAVTYALHSGVGPLGSIISHFHEMLGEERSRLFCSLSDGMDATSALAVAASV